jgi:hypothetical protein
MNIYPLRMSRSYWKIPLYCYHECCELCSFTSVYTDNYIGVCENKNYNHDTGKCNNYNKLFETCIDISSFNVSSPYGHSGQLYEPDLEVIPDNEFTILLTFPFTNPVEVDVKMKFPITIRILLDIIIQLYTNIYKEEEKTSDTTTVIIPIDCECVHINIKENLKKCNESLKDCSICYNSLDCDSDPVQLKCNHMFHRNCIGDWIDKGKGVSCPLCRSSLYECDKCNNTRIVETTEEYAVIPIHLRNSLFRNNTNGTYGIYMYDLDCLKITNMYYNRIKKLLQIKVSPN